MKGKLSNGFKYEVDVDVFNDMELIEAIAASEGDEPLRFVEVVERILGKEQKKPLYDSLRNEDGKVTVEAVGEAINEIMTAVSEDAEGKNS